MRARTSTRTSRRSRQYVDAGFDELYVQQIGPDQDGFFEFWTEELAPKLR